MLSEEDFHRLAEANFGDWSEWAVGDAVAGLAGPVPRESDERGVTWWRADGIAFFAPWTRDYDRRYGFGDLRLLVLSWTSLDLPAEYATVSSRARAVLGPPPRVGGPDAYQRWRRPGASIELSRRLPRSRICVLAQPTEPVERRAKAMADYDERGYGWTAYPTLPRPFDDAMVGATLHAPRPAATWDQFHDRCAEIFPVLAEDLPLLAEWTGEVLWTIAADENRFLQGWFSAEQVHAEIAGGVLDLPASAEAGRDVAQWCESEITRWRLDSPRQLSLDAWASQRGTQLDALFDIPTDS